MPKVEATPSLGEPISFDEFNFTFDPPARPWFRMDAKKLNPVCCLAFGRILPQVHFFIIAERPGFQVANDALAEIAINNLRSVADDSQVLEREPQTINGLDGVRLYVRAQIHGIALTYAYWVIATHGYFYQLVAYGAEADEDSVHSEAEDLWARFHLISSDRQAVAAAPVGEVLTTFDSTDFGVSMDVSGLGWRRSPRIAKELPSAIFSGERPGSTFFTLQAYRLGDLNPPIDYVARASCDVHQVSFDEATSVQHYWNGVVGTCTFEMSHTRQGIKYWGFYKVLLRPGFAYVLRAETANPAEIQNLEALSNQIHPDENFTGSAAVLGDEAKKSHKLLLNDIGIQYDDVRQFEEAAAYFAKALDYSPDTFVLNNLIGVYEMTGNYRDALATVSRGLQLWPNQATLLAKQAKLQAQSNDPAGALATFHGLFATDYRDDDSFHQYLLLLQKQGKTDDAIAVATAYLAKGDSEPIGIDLALLYDNKGQCDRATELLRARWAKEPGNVRVGTNLAMLLVEGRQFNEAAKLAQQLISAGSGDSELYLILGEAQYGLTWYRQAKDSFEAGQKKSPDNAILKKWIDLSSAKLGEGDNSAIKSPIEPVEIPSSLLSDDPAHPLPAPDVSQDAWYVRRINAISFVPKDHLKTSEYRLIRVLNQHGVESFSKFEFPFDSVSERIYLNKLEVRDEQGKVVATTDVSHCFVTDENQAESHSFRRVLNIPVEGLKANDTLEILITHEDVSPPAQMQYTFELFSAAYPGGLGAIYLTGNTGSVKSVQSAGVSAKPVEKGLCWSLSPIPQYHNEPQQPPADAFLPYVALGDGQATWEGVAKEYLDSISRQMDVDGDVTALSEELTHGMSSDAQKVAAIVKYVQHDYTYTAIEFGRRARIPNKAADVIHNKYGDCKDHAILLMQLLRAASVPANLALASFDQAIQPDLPSLDQFTHMIVCVPSMMPNGFFDCTNKLSEVQSGVPMGLGNHLVLLLDPAHPRLIRIPDYPADAYAINGSRTVSISDTGSVLVAEELSLNGSEAAGFRYFFNSMAQEERLNQMQVFLAGRGAAVVMEGLKIDNLDDVSRPLGLKLNYTMRNCFGTLSGQMIGSVPALLARYLLLAAPVDHRLTPFEYRYPMRLDYSSKLDLPNGYDLDSVPKTVSIADSYTAADVHFEREGASLTETLSLQSRPFDRPAADYNDFSQSREKLLESLEPQLHLVKR
jgi:tetratricopeptide (TPR) repeat protein